MRRELSHGRPRLTTGVAVHRELADFIAFKAISWHREPVNDSPILEVSGQSQATASTHQILEVWIRLCREFRERERREILEQEPAQEVLALYREELKWMIRAARALLNVVSDPDFPQTEFVSEISGKLLQLESSWKSLNNPLTEAEADAFVQMHFPDETPHPRWVRANLPEGFPKRLAD